jgi:hypothetical protein
MSTRQKHHTTRSQANLAVQIALPLSGYLSDAPPDASVTSATNTATLDEGETRYLAAWLCSRLEDGLWLLREESALTATSTQRRQITRLAHMARRRGLAVWPPCTRTQSQEVA